MICMKRGCGRSSLCERAKTLRSSKQTSPALFLFQAEDGIRDRTVTGVQTCALPIYAKPGLRVAQAQATHPVDEEPGDADRVESAAGDADHLSVRGNPAADDDRVRVPSSHRQQRGHVVGAMLAVAVERDPVRGTAPPGSGQARSQRLPLAEPARMPDDLGAGVGRSGAARIARAVVDDEHGRVPLRARGDARHGRLLVEHRDDDERCHRPMISATSLPPRPTPWTRLGRPLTRAALAAATTPSTPAPACAPTSSRSAERGWWPSPSAASSNRRSHSSRWRSPLVEVYTAPRSPVSMRAAASAPATTDERVLRPTP